MVEKIDSEEFNALINGGKTVVCDFYADWCGPCKMLAPVMEECSKKFADKAVFVKVNIDDNFDLAAKYGIMSIPLIGVFKGGEMVEKSLGFMPKSEAEEFFENNL